MLYADTIEQDNIFLFSQHIYCIEGKKKRERKSQHIYAGCRLIHQLRQRYTYIHVSNDRWMDGTGTAICCSDESMLFDRSMDKWPRVPDSCCFNRCVVRCPCLFVYAWHYHYYEIDVYREAAPTSRWTITQFGCNVYSERKKGSYEKTIFVDEHFNKSIYDNKPAFIGGPVKWFTCHQPTRGVCALSSSCVFVVRVDCPWVLVIDTAGISSITTYTKIYNLLQFKI